MLHSIPVRIIHMSSAVEREELVQRMETLFTQAQRMEAKRGDACGDKYDECRHPIGTDQPIQAGAKGCAESHFTVLAEALANDTGVLVLEDDGEWLCDSVGPIEEWIRESVPLEWDILLLGTSENVEKSKCLNFHSAQVWRFWGTHAVLFRDAEVIQKVLFTYDRMLREGVMPLADWWYSFAIKEHNLRAFSPLPCKRFVQQQPGLISYITGTARK